MQLLLCCINWFTSLCKNLFNLLEFLAEAFRCHLHHFQCLTVPVELAAASWTAASSTGTVKHWKWCTWHRKASAKNSSKLNKSFHSEMNQLVQHIIVQDQDGQNNNIHSYNFIPRFNCNGFRTKATLLVMHSK